MEVQGIEISVSGEPMEEKEVQAYVERAITKYRMKPESITLHADGEWIDIEYHFPKQRFQRLRRITGYLVGDMGRWNNGKRAEERDRVKHGTEEESND